MLLRESNLRKLVRNILFEYAESYEELPQLWQDWFEKNKEKLELEFIPNKGIERKAQSPEEYKRAFASDKRKGRYILFPRELPGGDILSMGWNEEQDPEHGWYDKTDPSKYWATRRKEGRKLKKKWAKETYRPNKEFFNNLHYVSWIRAGRGKHKIASMERLLEGDNFSEISTMFYDKLPFFFSKAMWLGAVFSGTPTWMSNINAHTGNYQWLQDDNVESDDPYLWMFSKERVERSGSQKYPALGYKTKELESIHKKARIWSPKDIDYNHIRSMQRGSPTKGKIGGGNNEALLDNWKLEKLILTRFAPETAIPFVYDLAWDYQIEVINEFGKVIYSPGEEDE